jgi:hypothetical protein
MLEVLSDYSLGDPVETGAASLGIDLLDFSWRWLDWEHAPPGCFWGENSHSTILICIPFQCFAKIPGGEVIGERNIAGIVVVVREPRGKHLSQ